jgi:RalA-binding protein 1
MGQYSDGRHHQVEQRRNDNHGDPSFLDAIASVPRVSIQSADHRAASPEKADANAKAKISGPIGGVPIPAGYKFGGKDPSADPTATSSTAFERREKAKSRLFWGFGRPNGDH